MSIVCALQTACWMFLLVASILVIAFFATMWDAISTEAHYCTRTQLRIGADCADRTKFVEQALNKINTTSRFLHHPSDYIDVAHSCNRTALCLRKITCEDGHQFAEEIKEMIPACTFYSFYTGEFKQCAEILHSKINGYPCLDILFNTKHEPEIDRCKQWEDIRPCVENAIESECDRNSTILASKFRMEAVGFYKGMNCTPDELLPIDETTMELIDGETF